MELKSPSLNGKVLYFVIVCDASMLSYSALMPNLSYSPATQPGSMTDCFPADVASSLNKKEDFVMCTQWSIQNFTPYSHEGGPAHNKIFMGPPPCEGGVKLCIHHKVYT